MADPTEVEKALAWLIDNSEGVVGLTLDGSVLPWDKVIPRYLPWWSGAAAERVLADDDPDASGSGSQDGEKG